MGKARNREGFEVMLADRSIVPAPVGLSRVGGKPRGSPTADANRANKNAPNFFKSSGPYLDTGILQVGNEYLSASNDALTP